MYIKIYDLTAGLEIRFLCVIVFVVASGLAIGSFWVVSMDLVNDFCLFYFACDCIALIGSICMHKHKSHSVIQSGWTALFLEH